MIEILEHPNKPCFTGNPALFKIRGTKYIVTPSQQVLLVFRKTGEVLEDQYFIFPDYKNGGTFQVTAKNVPDDSGLQVSSGKSIQDTASELNTVPLLVMYFDIWYANNYIIFRTKEAKSFNISELSCANIAYDVVVPQNGMDQVIRENYRVKIHLQQIKSLAPD
jgi:hypothetical protein